MRERVVDGVEVSQIRGEDELVRAAHQADPRAVDGRGVDTIDRVAGGRWRQGHVALLVGGRGRVAEDGAVLDQGSGIVLDAVVRRGCRLRRWEERIVIAALTALKAND